jgi:hypothetical protein
MRYSTTYASAYCTLLNLSYEFRETAGIVACLQSAGTAAGAASKGVALVTGQPKRTAASEERRRAPVATQAQKDCVKVCDYYRALSIPQADSAHNSTLQLEIAFEYYRHSTRLALVLSCQKKARRSTSSRAEPQSAVFSRSLENNQPKSVSFVPPQ